MGKENPGRTAARAEDLTEQQNGVLADPALLETMVGGCADEACDSARVLPRAASELSGLAGQALRPPHRPHLALMRCSDRPRTAQRDLHSPATQQTH